MCVKENTRSHTYAKTIFQKNNYNSNNIRHCENLNAANKFLRAKNKKIKKSKKQVSFLFYMFVFSLKPQLKLKQLV